MKKTRKKGVFWFYNFGNSLFTYAVPYDNDETVNFETCWEKISGPMSLVHTHKSWPRGRVTIKEGKAYVHLSPEIDKDEIKKMICEQFGLLNDIKVFFIPDESEEYACLITEDKFCTLCGKKFDFWDHEERCQFSHRTSRYSKYPQKNINLHLCCSCTDNLIEYIFSQGYTD